MSMGNFFEHATILRALCIVSDKHRILICDFSAKGNIPKIIVAVSLLMRIYTCVCNTDSLVECARSIR
jgi:hypothetical protein